LLHAGFLLGLFFDPEDGVDMFLRNFGTYLPNYTSSEICLQGYNVLLATCFTLVSYLAYSSILKMEATCSSERLDIVHCKRQTVLSSERAPHINKPANVRKKSDLKSQMGAGHQDRLAD
jgi:hypothetical protein